LQLAASLFETFCNDHRLFISTPKSFVTVFHDADDTGMVYHNDSVWVDGARVQIQVYGATLNAAPSFKYLGVVLNSTCSHVAHLEARQLSFDRAAALLIAGLSRIPSFPHRLVTYLWTALVAPVAGYGMDVFDLPQTAVDAFQGKERKWWRKLLQVGGRAPNATVHILMGLHSSTIAWRIRRATLWMKLANAPVGSWRHLAFMAHRHFNSPWFLAAQADLGLVLPGVRLIPTTVGTLPYLSSTSRWSDEGELISIHPYSLPVNANGYKFRPNGDNETLHSTAVRRHVHYVSGQLKKVLSRQAWTKCYNAVIEAATASPSSKLGLLAQRLQQAGPPLHIVLDSIQLPAHRAAMASFLCADWFLGKYAHNYFAKQLLPRTAAHAIVIQEAGCNSDTICLSCWHHRRVAILEDEFHCVCVCPEHNSSRQTLLASLPPGATITSTLDVLRLLASSDAVTVASFGQFLTNVRQSRRRLKLRMERMNELLCTKSFASKRVAWRLRGRYCCRHGVLFTVPPVNGCRCMSQSSSAIDWAQACFMPALSQELKCIIAVPFDRQSYTRLATLQAQARHLGW